MYPNVALQACCPTHMEPVKQGQLTGALPLTQLGRPQPTIHCNTKHHENEIFNTKGQRSSQCPTSGTLTTQIGESNFWINVVL